MHPNVAFALEKEGVPYTVRRHVDFPIAIRSPKEFANALRYELERITKTLFVMCREESEYAMVVCSATKRVNLTLVASHLDCKRVEVASREKLEDKIGYPPTGVSPIGAGAIPVFMDENLHTFQTVLVGSGEVGVEVEITPAHLERLTKARVLPISM